MRICAMPAKPEIMALAALVSWASKTCKTPLTSIMITIKGRAMLCKTCLLYTSDAADEL